MEHRGINTISAVRIGNPFQCIRHYLTDAKADLIVMGTAGHSQLEGMIIGSNTEKVVRHADCPVLTVHPGPAAKHFKNLVYAPNLGGNDEAFVRVVMNTREMYDSTIHLVRINTPMNFESDVKISRNMEAFAKTVGLENYTSNTFNHYKE